MNKVILLIIAIHLCIGNLFAQINEKPFVIPQLQEWNGGEGVLTLKSKVTIVFPQEYSEQLSPIAQTLSNDLRDMFSKESEIRIGTPKKGDIFMTLKPGYLLGEEGYKMNIGNYLTLEAPHPQGIFWGTRTLLQLMEQSMALPKGEITDYPKYEVRGFMLDCGRKFFTIDFLRDYVKFMSYYKMNTFQIHLNDNGFKGFFDDDWDKTYAAFRLESETYPGLTAKDGYYTKEEFIELQKLAEEYGVAIIPEIDAPAHTLAFTHYKPEIGSKDYGMDHLDLFNPETYTFMDGLFREYLEGPNPVFRGKRVHIGTDEYSNKDQQVVEKFRYFTDHYIKFVEQYGKQAVVWGALTHAKGETPVKSENVIMSAWYNGYADPKKMVEAGYDLISIPDGYLYIVPAAGYYYDYLNTKYLYEHWEPVQVGGVRFRDNDPAILGGMFAVWNDHVGNGISHKDVHHRVWPAMQTLAVKMWSGSRDLIPFDEFNEKREKLSEAPDVNILGRVKNARQGEPMLVKEILQAEDMVNVYEIGYNYRVEFELNLSDVSKGTVLFQNKNATVYASDPKTGKLGFERDGYLNTFDYVIPTGQSVRLAFEGDNRETRLFVNGELKETLEPQSIVKPNDKKMQYIQTLVFPLAKVGNINGDIRNLQVTVL